MITLFFDDVDDKQKHLSGLDPHGLTADEAAAIYACAPPPRCRFAPAALPTPSHVNCDFTAALFMRRQWHTRLLQRRAVYHAASHAADAHGAGGNSSTNDHMITSMPCLFQKGLALVV